MRTIKPLHLFLLMIFTVSAASAQARMTIIDPTKNAPETKPTDAQQKAFDEVAFPKVSAKLKSDSCSADPTIAGVASGSFTKAGAKESIIFYQVCETGNGLGWVGLVVLDAANKVIGNYVSDSGWAMDISTVKDVNKNGRDEFALSFGGGMHQGQSGMGVDIDEITNGAVKGLGWYKAAEMMDGDPTSVWKLTATAAAKPIFFTQKFTTKDEKRYTPVGQARAAKLTGTVATFEAVK